jgi:hypothetical protein
MHLACRLNLSSFEADAGQTPSDGTPSDDDVVDPGSNPPCSTLLHFARTTTTSGSGPCDLNGIVGATCLHCIPLLGAFMDMHGPEQFIYFLILLAYLCRWAATHNVSIRDVYIDVGCRLVKTWQRYVAGQPDLAAAGLRIMVNWMHGSSHDIGCQLQNCGRFQEGAGRKVGENSEQLWSMLKVC